MRHRARSPGCCSCMAGPVSMITPRARPSGTLRTVTQSWRCDMFGDGVAGDRERVMACLTGLRDDPQRMSRRAQAGLTALAACPEADGRFAAVGFCFGGLAVLTLARSGADVMGVVSMHGSLATVRSAEPGAVTAKVLVCHGVLDPHVPL